MMLLGRFTGVYIDFDPSNSVEIQDYDFYTSQKNMALKWVFGNEIMKIIYLCCHFENILQGQVFWIYTYSKF